MKKIAFLFPGQGSQEVGMARDLFESDPFFKSLIELGSDYCHEDLEKICLTGPEKTLRYARFLQPILAAVCFGYHKKLIDSGIKPDFVLGHSLGEITSLGAAGVLSYEDAVIVAAKRGELMDTAAAKCNGTMMAVLFVSLETVMEYIADMNDDGKIVLANDNAPNQVVLAGEIDALDAFAERIIQEKTGRCRKLPVAGPWHSNCMTEARVVFEEWVRPVIYQKPHTPLILNATGKEETDTDEIKYRNIWQLTRPVYWRESMERCRSLGVDTLIEIGPGRVLSGLARVNGFKKGSNVYTANTIRGIEQIVSAVCENKISGDQE
ncbi:MAG: acyltransferase domain-containing protein [Chitinivibrionales bacterium]|nr:acyltransferase domain-containing protein [Chitinivibrionales bacterium]